MFQQRTGRAARVQRRAGQSVLRVHLVRLEDGLQAQVAAGVDDLARERVRDGQLLGHAAALGARARRVEVYRVQALEGGVGLPVGGGRDAGGAAAAPLPGARAEGGGRRMANDLEANGSAGLLRARRMSDSTKSSMSPSEGSDISMSLSSTSSILGCDMLS
ncbi:hypothetical protein VP1G_10930 [Cytospora mali]|uniref:Uncharacterized protein n=1 Tax=Cytospora mali TaxID=578113 RepID=A0A194V1Z5_CYTMA|nr:hypothetical protein VP1G_10930 [Valsa mali var. pyri (nom. inval.)]